MRPINTIQTNHSYLMPPGMEGDPLPCCRTNDGRVISVWEPTPDERAAIAAGGNVELHVWQQPPPPVGFTITRLTEVPPEMTVRDA